MKRLIIAGTIALLLTIIIGSTIGQDSLIQALVSNDPLSHIVRFIIVGLLAGLLFTAPPRSIDFRTALMIASGMLTIGVAVMLSQFYIAPLDAILFVEVAIIFALEAIESPMIAKRPGKKIPVDYRPQRQKISI